MVTSTVDVPRRAKRARSSMGLRPGEQRRRPVRRPGLLAGSDEVKTPGHNPPRSAQPRQLASGEDRAMVVGRLPTQSVAVALLTTYSRSGEMARAVVWSWGFTVATPEGAECIRSGRIGEDCTDGRPAPGAACPVAGMGERPVSAGRTVRESAGEGQCERHRAVAILNRMRDLLDPVPVEVEVTAARTWGG